MGKKDKNSANQAICADCGVKFELPFKPTGDKPVYCNECFSKRRNNQSDRPNFRDRGRDRDRGRGRDRDRNRQMFSAVCDKCGRRCEVPFRPTEGKPIYCDNCFGKERSTAPRSGNQMQDINNKLDKIINALVDAKIIKLSKKTEPAAKTTQVIKEAKKPEIKKKATSPKKAAPKKKSPAKKKTAAKKKK